MLTLIYEDCDVKFLDSFRSDTVENLFTYSSDRKTCTKSLNDGYMVIARSVEPLRSPRWAFAVHVHEVSGHDLDIGVAKPEHSWSNDWLRYAPETAWYVDQSVAVSGCTIHIEVNFEADYSQVVFGIREPGSNIVSFVKKEYCLTGPLYAAVAIRAVGDSVTIVPARFGQIQPAAATSVLE